MSRKAIDGFNSVFSSLGPGQSMNVQFKGLGTTTSGTVVAHAVASSVIP